VPSSISGWRRGSGRARWSASLALGLRAGTDEIQITHIAKDLLRR